MQNLNINSKIVLDNGVEIPMLGLGVYLSKQGSETINAVSYALETGYRHFDTAAFYQNETEVGKAIRESNIPQEEIFVTTKVWNSDQGYDNTMRAFDASFKRLGLDSIDLYLIHWPEPGLRKDTWRALIKIYQTGMARSIGISNYTINHIEEIIKDTPIIPAVNQVELTPFLSQTKLVEYCWKNRINIEAYSPLVRGRRMNDPRLAKMAEKYNKTAAQILIRWSLQNNFICIPKSVNPHRIKENTDIYDFNISPEDIESMKSWNEDSRIAWNPEKIN